MGDTRKSRSNQPTSNKIQEPVHITPGQEKFPKWVSIKFDGVYG